MSLVGRLLGIDPPKIPEGAQLLVCDTQAPGPLGMSYRWWVAYVRAGDDETDVSQQHKCSPTFDDIANAQAWRDWMLDPKGKPFSYPAGAA